MATIKGAIDEKVFTISNWLGLNEHPDGDQNLKMGEAAKMVNWKITRDGNLKRRPGREYVTGLCASYDIDVSDVMVNIGAFNIDDTITVYSELTAEEVPGKVTPVWSLGSVVRGELQGIPSTVDEGEFDADSAVQDRVQNGVYITDDSELDDVSLRDLEGMLSELEAGEYLYMFADEIPYALNLDCYQAEGNIIHLGGYIVTAAAESETKQKIAGMWAGLVNGQEKFLAACDGTLWQLYNAGTDTYTRTPVGSLDTSKGVTFIPWDNKVYVLNGFEYYVYNGTTLSAVDGYRPLVAISIGPEGGDSQEGVTTGEYVNLLNGKRRVWISPDGVNRTFQLPEKDIKSVDAVIVTYNGLPTGLSYDVDLINGTVTFTSTNPPAKAVNSHEIQYSVKTHDDDGNIPDYRAQVTGNLFYELYAGTMDTRIFVYGDGTNKTRYTGMDYYGVPRADYFPDQYEVLVGDSNTPITAMIRHYGTLVCYKLNECWSLQHGIIELATSELTPAIYCAPVNRDKGNIAPGQVRLVENDPVTCSGTELYRWVNSSYYSSDLSRDERQARRISDRISRSIKEINFKTCLMWDDNDNQEFYIVDNGIALVWNYVQDAWYRYENYDAVQMCNFHGDLYIGTSDGRVYRQSYSERGDDGIPIYAEWESGAMSFGTDYQRKYSSMMWVGLKPEDGTSVDVCVETDRKDTFRDKIVSSEKAKIHGQPFMVKTKIKAKKFVYYRLVLKVVEKEPAVTVTNIDFRVRQTGYAK